MERRDFIAMLAATPAALSTAEARDQPVTPVRPLSITLLGTGTPSPSLERQSSGYLIEAGRDVIVWDQRRRMDDHGRPRAARPAVSGMSRVPHRHTGRIDLLHRRQRSQRRDRGSREGLRHPHSHESLSGAKT